MTDTHEAARLADALDDIAATSSCMYEAETTQAAALLRRIPELEAELQTALGQVRYLIKDQEVKAAERDQLRAEVGKTPNNLGRASMMGDEIFAGIFKDEVRTIENAVVLTFGSKQELRAFLAWHFDTAPPATQGSEE